MFLSINNMQIMNKKKLSAGSLTDMHWGASFAFQLYNNQEAH